MAGIKQDRNQPDVSEKRLKELGILKVLKVSISDDGVSYLVLTEDGEKKFIPESELLGIEEQ